MVIPELNAEGGTLGNVSNVSCPALGCPVGSPYSCVEGEVLGPRLEGYNKTYVKKREPIIRHKIIKGHKIIHEYCSKVHLYIKMPKKTNGRTRVKRGNI